MEIDLGVLLRTIRRLWWVPVVAALLLGLAGFGITFFESTKYTSTTQLLVTSQISGDEVLADESRTATFENLVTSGPVLDRVILELGLDYTRQELSDMITVDVINGTQIISVTVTSDDLQLSADIANALARNFVTTATDLSVGELQRNLDELESQSASIRDQITVIDTRLAEIDTDANANDSQIQAEITQLKQDRLKHSQVLADIEQSIRKLNTSLSSMSLPVTVTDFAQPDEEGQKTNPILLAVLGVFVGGLIGAGVILWSAYTDTTLREVEQMTVGPVLAHISKQDMAEDASAGIALLAAKVSGLSKDAGNTLALVSARKATDVGELGQRLGGYQIGSYSNVVPVTGALDSPDDLRRAFDADAAIVVASQGHSKLNEVEDVAEILRASGVPTIGSVVISN